MDSNTDDNKSCKDDSQPEAAPCSSSNAASSANSNPTSCASPCGDLSGAEKIGRARFIKGGLGAVAVLWSGMTLYPVYSYLKPKKGQDDEGTKVSSIEVCKLSELPKGYGRNFRFGSAPALVIHGEDGELHAFKAICTHLGCTVQFREDMQVIYCACHGGQYDALTGKNTAGPPPKPLAPLKAAVVDGKIIVSRA